MGLKKTNSTIKLYGRRKEVKIPTWLFELESIFSEMILNEEDDIISKIIDESYKKGNNDRWIISSLPITESGYYRIKRKIEEKIYEIYIFKGYVSQSEIKKNRIIE